MKYYFIALLLALSALTHFAFWGQPAEVVFDEVHFGRFAMAYSAGEYYFDIHPPLGKLLIAGGGKIGNFQTATSTFDKIGTPYNNPDYIYLRLLPLLAGFLLPLVIFLLALRLNFSKIAAFAAGLFVILENSILVQSRFALLDSFLLLFGFSSLLFYLCARQTNKTRTIAIYTVLAAISAGLAFSIKWTGLSFLGLICLVEAWEFFFSKDKRPARKTRLIKIATYLGVSFLVYFSVFALHFTLLPKSGPGDAFMTPEFQKTLTGSRYTGDPEIKPIGLFNKFTELNKRMYTANQTLTASHPDAAKWYEWPLGKRPVYYWNETIPGSQPAKEAKIYLLGNVLVYWAGALAVIMSLFFLRSRVARFLLAGYLANLLPFVFIGRVMFIYHYLTALIFAILILAWLIDQIKNPRWKLIVAVTLSLVFGYSFYFFNPTTYGLPMEIGGQESRVKYGK